MTQMQETPPAADTVTPELVAKTVSGIHQIGYAHRALTEAGHVAKITGNRITVDGTIEALLTLSGGGGWWQIYHVDGKPPVWTVGAFDESSSNWLGAD